MLTVLSILGKGLYWIISIIFFAVIFCLFHSQLYSIFGPIFLAILTVLCIWLIMFIAGLIVGYKQMKKEKQK